MGDRSLEKFRVEYEKLHRALKKSHDSEKRLMQKCRELNAEIVANSAKVATALKLSQEDQTTIASLKKVKLSADVCTCKIVRCGLHVSLTLYRSVLFFELFNGMFMTCHSDSYYGGSHFLWQLGAQQVQGCLPPQKKINVACNFVIHKPLIGPSIFCDPPHPTFKLPFGLHSTHTILITC